LDLTIGQSEAKTDAAETVSPYFSASTAEKLSISSKARFNGRLRGGILLRSVQYLDPSLSNVILPTSTSSPKKAKRKDKGQRVVSGPSLLVDEILSLSGASTIAELVGDKWDGNTSAFPFSSSTDGRGSDTRLSFTPVSSVQLRPSQEKRERAQIYRSPRIGLDLSAVPPSSLSSSSGSASTSHPHPRIIYLGKPYRYFTNPHLLTAKGQAHTFLGVLEHVHQATSTPTPLAYADVDINNLAKITALKPSTIQTYLSTYSDSLNLSTPNAETVLKTFVGTKGREGSGNVKGWLKMAGVLKRLGYGA
jgi:hypothetical protein